MEVHEKGEHLIWSPEANYNAGQAIYVTLTVTFIYGTDRTSIEKGSA